MKLLPYTDGCLFQARPWTGPAGDPRSLDPSEASERLHNLFNREGAISCCIVPSPGVRNHIALCHP
jgi:hypothetical protein